MTVTNTLPDRTFSGQDIGDLISLLNTQEAHKLDFVAPASSILASQANLAIGGLDPVLTDEGFFEANGLYRPTKVVYQQLANIFDVPSKYLRKMATGDSADRSLFDSNINHWASKETDRQLLIRTLWGQDEKHPGTSGLVRAVVSDRYGITDNLDTVMAVISGLSAAGLDDSCIRALDLTEDRLYMKVESPQIEVNARDFLGDYRSPYTGQSAKDLPIVGAGITFRNSEVGTGAFEIAPYLVVRVCSNGLTMTHDKFARRHVGGRLEAGVVRWSEETRKAATTFVTAQVTDATKAFLNADYVQKSIDKLAQDSGEAITDVVKTIEVVGRELLFSEDEQKGILNAFVKGGQLTSGGVLQAVTAYSQQIVDADRRYELNDTGLAAMGIAARLARSAA